MSLRFQAPVERKRPASLAEMSEGKIHGIVDVFHMVDELVANFIRL